jgi:hypothetical protein
MMCWAQSEALGKYLEQALVVSFGVLDHYCIGLKHDVDGRDQARLVAPTGCTFADNVANTQSSQYREPSDRIACDTPSGL